MLFFLFSLLSSPSKKITLAPSCRPFVFLSFSRSGIELDSCYKLAQRVRVEAECLKKRPARLLVGERERARALAPHAHTLSFFNAVSLPSAAATTNNAGGDKPLFCPFSPFFCLPSLPPPISSLFLSSAAAPHLPRPRSQNLENSKNKPADHSVFVGDLAPEVTDLALQEAFRAFFPSVRSAKVITDPSTGRSRGYGFVRFGDGGERDAALARMQGHPLCDRPIRVSPATAKKGGEMMGGGGQQGGGNRGFGGFGGGPGGGQFGGFGGGGPGGYGNAMIGGNGYGGGGGGHPAPSDPNLATIFVGNLADAGDAELRAAFGHLGEVLYTKVPPGKGCGFVQFAARPSAEAAIASMQGALVGSQHVRVSWGRGPCAPPRAPPGALLPGGIGEL